MTTPIKADWAPGSTVTAATLNETANAVNANTASTTTSGTFNVKKYGALGNNSADDTAAIHAAINACMAAGGGTVFFPAGTYRHTGITVPENAVSVTNSLNIVGANKQSTVLMNTHATNTSLKIIGVWANAGARGFSVSDLTISSTAAVLGRAGQTGLYIAIGVEYAVDRIRVSNHGVGIESASSFAQSYNDVRIGGCTIGLLFSKAPATGGACPVTVVNLNIYGCPNGVQSIDQAATQLSFHGGTINGTTGPAFYSNNVDFCISFFGVMFEHDADDDFPFVVLGSTSPAQGPQAILFSNCGFQTHFNMTTAIDLKYVGNVTFDSCRIWSSSGAITNGIKCSFNVTNLTMVNPMFAGVTNKVVAANGTPYVIPTHTAMWSSSQYGSKGMQARWGSGVSRQRVVQDITVSATPAINADITEVAKITGLNLDITNMGTNVTGTIVDGQELEIHIRDDGTPRAINWGSAKFFPAKGMTLPTRTLGGSSLLFCRFVANNNLWSMVDTNFRTPMVGVINIDSYGSDPTGVAASDTALSLAKAALGSGPGVIRFGPGTYKLTAPCPSSFIQGQGVEGVDLASTLINYSGTGFLFDAHDTRSVASGGPRDGGPFTGFTVDGTSAGAASGALNIGDLNATTINIVAANFTGAGSCGVLFENRISWAERTDARIIARRNTQGVVFAPNGGANSYDYSKYNLAIGSNANQDGLVLKNNAGLLGCDLNMVGNFNTAATNTGTVVIIGTTGSDTAQIHGGIVNISVESNGSPLVTHKTFNIGANALLQGTGSLKFSAADGGAFTAGNARARTAFTGYIDVDTNLGRAAFFQGARTIGVQSRLAGSLSSSGTLFIGSGNIFVQRMNTGAITFALGTEVSQMAGQAVEFDIIMQQPASGTPTTVTWPGSPTWVWTSGTDPTLKTAANARDFFHVISADCTTFFATHVNP